MDATADNILAIDPGSEQSAWVLYDLATDKPARWMKEHNTLLLARIGPQFPDAMTIIEDVSCYGMRVGREVFTTCKWIGRFDMALKRRCEFIERPDIKLHLCGKRSANDADVRAALIDRFGPGNDKAVGVKANPGPLHGMKSDCWSALALACVWADRQLAPAAAVGQSEQ